MIVLLAGLGHTSRRRSHTLVTLAALLLPVPTAHAQAVPDDTLRLSLAELLSRIRGAHPVTRVGTASVSAAQARAAALRRYENPALEVDRAALSEVDIRLLQPVRWPRESRALRALGQADIATAQADAEAALRTVALDVSERYADGLRETRLVGLAVEAESLAQRARDRAVAARELGQAGDLTVLEAEVTLDASRRARFGVQADRAASVTGLAVLLGEDPDRPIAFEGELATLAPLAAPESALVQSFGGDPEAGRILSAAERARQEAELARARRWPRLEIGPAVGLGGNGSLGVAMGLSLPLWNRQADAIRAADSDLEAALARLDARRQELTELVLRATGTLARADQERSLLRSGQLARAEEAESLASRALQQGGPYLAVWLTARQAYLDARRAELDLEWQAARARLLLHHLTGTLLQEVAR